MKWCARCSLPVVFEDETAWHEGWVCSLCASYAEVAPLHPAVESLPAPLRALVESAGGSGVLSITEQNLRNLVIGSVAFPVKMEIRKEPLGYLNEDGEMQYVSGLMYCDVYMLDVAGDRKLLYSGPIELREGGAQ